jgi:hypothetical protein
VASDHVAVGVDILLGHDVDLVEVPPQAGACDLSHLIVAVTLGQQDDAMAARKGAERRRHLGQMRAGPAAQRRAQPGNHGRIDGAGRAGQARAGLLEAGLEVRNPVAEPADTLPFDLDQPGSSLVRQAAVSPGQRHVVGDDGLEIDVVLPEGVVGVDEERQTSGWHGGTDGGNERILTAFTPRKHRPFAQRSPS